MLFNKVQKVNIKFLSQDIRYEKFATKHNLLIKSLVISNIHYE